GEAKEVFSDRTGGKNWFEYHINALSGKTSLVPQPGGQSDAMTNAFMRLPCAPGNDLPICPLCRAIVVRSSSSLHEEEVVSKNHAGSTHVTIPHRPGGYHRYPGRSPPNRLNLLAVYPDEDTLVSRIQKFFFIHKNLSAQFFPARYSRIALPSLSTVGSSTLCP
ncbi:MAG: hypothetical protein LBR88_05945, partial [Zoogloeaceae bacterium]|nr:hypothetical protein [Zoogloeaceae bacterium]